MMVCGVGSLFRIHKGNYSNYEDFMSRTLNESDFLGKYDVNKDFFS